MTPQAHAPLFGAPAQASTELSLRLRFEGWLRGRIPERVEVVWTQNRVRLASSARRGGQLVLRLHALFAHGGEAEAEDLVALLLHRARARGARLQLWFAEARLRHAPQGSASPPSASANAAPPSPCASPAPTALPRARALAPLLLQLFAELNAAYFHNGCRASIRWGRGGHSPRRRRRSMQLGCFDFARQEIRIHPALNQGYVPRFVVALVVYHEMLHEVFGLDRRGGRRCAHPPEFYACEQSHPDYQRARTWETQNLGRLLAWRA